MNEEERKQNGMKASLSATPSPKMETEFPLTFLNTTFTIPRFSKQTQHIILYLMDYISVDTYSHLSFPFVGKLD